MDLNKILSDIKLPTNKVSTNSIQAIVNAAKKYDNTSEDNLKLWINILETLWMHLKIGFDLFNDQLRCAKCFYSVLYLSQKQEYYLKEIENMIQLEINRRESNTEIISKAEQMVALMNGIFQSSLLRERTRETDFVPSVLQAMFRLLLIMAYDYSKITGMVFKTLQSFKKVCGTDLEKYVFTDENKIKLLNLVNHNWENPLTGIRDVNKEIFQTLLSVLNGEMYDEVLQEINAFYWNKAKYIMIAEIIKDSNKNIIGMIESNDWINSLISSLSKPGIVSAGADMYFEILKKIKNENEWCKFFMKPALQVLNGTSSKAIENFSNYWCLTTFKTYPSLPEIIFNEVNNFEDSELKLYSFLNIVKQANRLGLLKKKWAINNYNEVGNTVLQCLDNCNNQIRLMAFEILCISQKKTMREKTEYDMVMRFLENNVNSDCTVLRISLLNSFHNFITQLHLSYVNNFENSETLDKENMKNFCSEFQSYIVNSLEIGGNYQRKITCIKLISIFLNELTLSRHPQTRSCGKPIIKMLMEEGYWSMFDENVITLLMQFLKDPANDVREVTMQLLTRHYSKEISQTSKMNGLIDEALKSMSSKFFYEIGCGQTMFKLIINIMMKENVEANLSTAEDVFNFASSELISEYKKQRNVLESIEKGKQLHSFVSILYVVLHVCLENRYTFEALDENVYDLLEVLEGISNQFAWEQEMSTSSDFSKMSDMVQSIIESSGYDTCNPNDQSKITGLQQIVLNCLWLNVKGSCELLSVLIRHQKDDSRIAICKKALEIISHVLETCRHKGAIEAAGAAFGQSIQHLTSLSVCRLSELPLTFLMDKLNQLIHEAVRMPSVTRRGAGLSIMVHRTVSSDVNRHKPLFHYFMKTILETCNNANTIPNAIDKAENIDNVKDLPKAIYIHFLTRVVTDSSLASHMMFYSANLAELAFGNLTSPYWQIRNAALQLYGALVQKLIGQKKPAGQDDESIATVACDELRTHSPKLWTHIQNQLQNITYDDKVQYHSDLVPILNTLANTARRYNFTSDLAELKDSDEELLKNLLQLLDSPINTVRRLVAKCIYNCFDFKVVYGRLAQDSVKSENYLHGSLLLIANYYKLHKGNNNYQKQFEDLRKKYEVLLNDTMRVHSYVCRDIFDDIFPTGLDIHQIREVLLMLKINTYSPGIFLWAKKIIERKILNSSWAEIPLILNLLLDCDNFEEFIDFLLSKLEEDQYFLPKQIVLEITDALMKFNNKLNSSTTWKILYILCSKTVFTSEESSTIISEGILKHFEDEDVSYKLRYMIPFAARIMVMAGDTNNLIHITKVIVFLTDPEKDVEMRYIAALANNEIAGILKSVPECCKIDAIKAAVVLLQDEDEDVRILCSQFYLKAMNIRTPLQPYICLLKMLNCTFLDSLLSKNGIHDFCEAMRQFVVKNSNKIVDEYNPFSSDCNNIYLELSLLSKLIESVRT